MFSREKKRKQNRKFEGGNKNLKGKIVRSKNQEVEKQQQYRNQGGGVGESNEKGSIKTKREKQKLRERKIETKREKNRN